MDEKKKHPGGRPSKYNATFHPLLAESLARLGYTDKQMSEAFGITEATLCAWKKTYPEFFKSLKLGKEQPDDAVESSLLKRALGYKYDEVTRERIVDSGQKKRHGGESKYTAKDWEYAQTFFGNACCYCGSKTDMTKDHVVPLSTGGELSRDNIVPACLSCNSAKKDIEMELWYRKQKFFRKSKLDKIHAYLEEMKKEKPTESTELVVTKVVRKEQPPDVTAQIFWLKNRRPGRWRDKQDVKLSGDVQTTTVTMSPEERKAMFESLMKK
jgi:hypothetical protein